MTPILAPEFRAAAHMDVLQAIYERRAVRSYLPRKVEEQKLRWLLDAAVQAPSGMNTQPWSFAILEDRDYLARCSDRVKAFELANMQPGSATEQHRQWLEDPAYNVFYDAGTLVIICATPNGMEAAEDCCLAAQNFMLAACAMGLGTCPIGLARRWMEQPGIKREIGIPQDRVVVMPIIVGYPRGQTPAVERREPEILAWR